jgi:Fe-S-cluster containining protein
MFEPAEGEELALALGLDVQEFYVKHTRLVRGRWSLKEAFVEGHGYDCEFLDRTTAPGRALCRVHRARPEQCRTWPFWPRALATRQAWKREAADCPGIENGLAGTGTLHPAAVIAEQAGRFGSQGR